MRKSLYTKIYAKYHGSFSQLFNLLQFIHILFHATTRINFDLANGLSTVKHLCFVAT